MTLHRLRSYVLAAHRPNLAALRDECIRLRRSERLSLKEIKARTGACQGSLSLWLRPFPLVREEKDAATSRARVRALVRGCTGSLSKARLPVSTLFHEPAWTRQNTSSRGAVSEMQVMCRLMRHGIEVYRPMADGSLYDIVAVPPGGTIVKVQVKTVKMGIEGNGFPLVSLRRTRGHNMQVRYASGEFDVLVGYDPRTDTAYVFLEDEVAHLRRTVTIRPDAAERWDKILSFQRRQSTPQDVLATVPGEAIPRRRKSGLTLIV